MSGSMISGEGPNACSSSQRGKDSFSFASETCFTMDCLQLTQSNESKVKIVHIDSLFISTILMDGVAIAKLNAQLGVVLKNLEL